ncbi:MAG: hypothetical protein H5U20_03130 [Rhodobacteraceae bacterium]|nr:hypothetical protein [Paracoccaceae bacterium]
MAVTVRVDGARGNREIEDTVTQGVRAGLEQYDRGLATRVRQISADPGRVL